MGDSPDDYKFWKDAFPTLPEATIRQHMHLPEDQLYLKLESILELGDVPVQASNTGQAVPQPTFTAQQQGDIDCTAMQKQMLGDALWAELWRREKFLKTTRVTRSTKEETDISMFLRDTFFSIRMSTISEMVRKKDFYQCIIILRLIELGWIKQLQKYEFLPPSLSNVQVEPDRVALREKESKEMNRAPLPEMAKNMWKAYEEIVAHDYTAEILKVTRFDCPICFDTFNFNDAIGCRIFDMTDEKYEPHNFCKGCIKQHAVASATQMTMGPGGCGLKCPEHQCSGIILTNDVEDLLDANQKLFFTKRVDEAALQAAEMKDLVRCPRCPFAGIAKDEETIFYCENEECSYIYCRLCEKEYDEKHEGRTCDEVEVAVDDARKKKEEELTLAVIRTCAKCNLDFTKDGGCNVVTCNKCQTTQCWACRAININHDHLNVCKMTDDEVSQRDQQERLAAIERGRQDALIRDQMVKLQ